MRSILSLISINLILSLSLFGQTKTISGKVIGQVFQPISDFKINILDSTLMPNIDGSTGEFLIKIPTSVYEIKFIAVGFDPKYIILDSNCSKLEIILQNNIFGEDPIEEIDNDRLKLFRKQLKQHIEAFNEGLFKFRKPCYKQKFIPSSKLKRFQNVIL
jgi:hypothetical protein